MKKWHIIVLSIAAFVTVLIVGGSVFYRYYLVPEYLTPVMEKVRDYVNEDRVLDELYEQAIRLREEGVIDESTYAEFINAYEKRNRDAESYAREILNAKDDDKDVSDTETTSVSARYASTKVGVETIQTNNGRNSGASTRRYSKERTSERIRAEDIVEAEKVLHQKELEAEAEDEAETNEEIKESAYSKLKSKMTAEEFKTFLEIMSKMDTEVLASFVDKESRSLTNAQGLKDYMHSCLADDEYKTIVNLGYKYVHLFIEE